MFEEKQETDAVDSTSFNGNETLIDIQEMQLEIFRQSVSSQGPEKPPMGLRGMSEWYDYNWYRRMTLQRASRGGKQQVVELLLHYDADVNAQDLDDALQEAIVGGQETIVKMLLEHGANMNGPVAFRAALRLASDNGHEIIVKIASKWVAEVDALHRRLNYNHV